jgi:Putative Interleukin 2 receptor, gamma chain
MSFIIVKYGANEEKIINSNCVCAVMLGYIKKQCCADINENIDLATEVNLYNTGRRSYRFIEQTKRCGKETH